MRTALLLNATYEPLAIVPIRRAVVLVLANKAEVIESGESRLRSARSSVPLPRVIRLVRYVKVPYRHTVPFSKRAVMARDRSRCVYCGVRATTIDHVLPRSRGGRDEWTNCVAACKACNSRKGDRLLAELGWTLHTAPTAPKMVSWVVIGLVTVDPAWEPYLGMELAG